jgi:Predicted membrane protein (DUF2207)
MPAAADSAVSVLAVDWISLAVLFAVYVLILVTLRWGPRSISSTVTQYNSPAGVSPALAAFLWNGSAPERAFVSALISLSWKGYLQVRQNQEWYVLEKQREPDGELPFEESAILSGLFHPQSIRVCKFNSRDCYWILRAYHRFNVALVESAEREYISAHLPIWFASILLSIGTLAFLFWSTPVMNERVSLASIIYLGLFIAVGASAGIAAMRAWPATLRKFASYVRRDGRPRRPLEALDFAPVVLTASSLLGFAFLAALTSTRFAILVTLLFFTSIVFKRLLKAPNRAARQILTKLRGYREFLARAEADRLNRENQPGATAEVLENCTAYAVALDVEHGWGEEFVENVLEMIQFDSAYGDGVDRTSESVPLARGEFDPLSDHILQLHLPRGRKT